jgi:serine protease Do
MYLLIKIEAYMKIIQVLFFILLLTPPVLGGALPHKEQHKQTPEHREEITLSYGPVVKRVAPAVVNIYTLQHPQVKLPGSPLLKDPFFKQFFERVNPQSKEDQVALGSGVIVNKEGYILTNFHVIENAETIQVNLADTRTFLAKLITADKRSDLALLKIDSKEAFPYLEVKPQEDLEVGDVVLAIGNPFGVGQTVTHGIISALARPQEGISDFRSFIQTDAAINPGNSGGALITTDGRLVGINTAIYSKSGGSVGIGFAIPTTLAIPVIESLKTGGEVIRPWLGIELAPKPLKIFESLGFTRRHGVKVANVYPGGPAQKAGLKAGDIITNFDGTKIEDEALLEYKVAISPIGKQTTIQVFRQGVLKTLPLKLTKPSQGRDPYPFTINNSSPLKGATLRLLSPALALKMGLNPMNGGIVITEVASKGPAARLGVLPGDILVAINEQKVMTKKELMTLVQNNKHIASLTFIRGTKLLKINVQGIKNTIDPNPSQTERFLGYK